MTTLIEVFQYPCSLFLLENPIMFCLSTRNLVIWAMISYAAVSYLAFLQALSHLKCPQNNGGALSFNIWHREGQGQLPFLFQDWSLPSWGSLLPPAQQANHVTNYCAC
jgi:hypothetical protein